MVEPLLGVVIKEFKHEGHKFLAGQDLEDGGEGGTGVVEPGLAASPVKKFETGKNILVLPLVIQDV